MAALNRTEKILGIVAASITLCLLIVGAIFIYYNFSAGPTPGGAPSPAGLGSDAPGLIAAPPANQPVSADLLPVAAAGRLTTDLAPGWPIALPGAICSTPVLADVTGDGKLSIIITCGKRGRIPIRHPKPQDGAYAYALSIDGTLVPGWPVQVGVGGTSGQWAAWSSSPSVARVNGRDELVMIRPRGGSCVIHADRGVQIYGGGDRISNVPVVDLAGNGVLTFLCGAALRNIDGSLPACWTQPPFKDGYAPAVGDVFGDGSMYVCHLFYSSSNGVADVVLTDHTGKVTPGWPRQIHDPSCMAPVIGDITGDSKMEIVAAYGHSIFAWSRDGKPVPNAARPNGVLVDDVFASTASPALADLEGTGKADIVFFDSRSHTLRAFRGDGTGISRPDGELAMLSQDCHGVSVVSLGDDGEMDFFTGTYWIRRQRDGKLTFVDMVPNHRLPQIEWTQPTVADVENNGTADVIFGTSDGRVFLYRTHMKLKSQGMQWPTANHDFQHTGAWKKPS